MAINQSVRAREYVCCNETIHNETPGLEKMREIVLTKNRELYNKIVRRIQ